jgi:hypothetical protein
VWKEGWRCLHAPTAEVSAQLLVEGHPGPLTVRRHWPDGADLDAGAADGLDRLAWDSVLSAFRPFLTHSELESMLGAPKALHDHLNDILGLDDLAGAAKRLGAARLAAEKTVRAARDALPALRSALEAADDERAAAGSAPAVPGRLDALHAVEQLTGPDPDTLSSTSAALTAAADGLDRLADSDANEAAATARLLQAALDHYKRHGPGDCPVCAAPHRLDAPWQDATRAAVERLRTEAEELRAATDTARRALEGARSLVGAASASLRADSGVDTSAALTAWDAWTNAPQPHPDPATLRAWAAHLDVAGHALAAAVDDLSAAARAETARRADRWAPVAAQLSVWCRLARDAADAQPKVTALKKTETWLKGANDQIRNDRLRPFAQQAVALWAQLRQESNVDLTAMRLAGSATHARVDFDVTVDGTDAAALGVMSQGEVNALALSVFIPRATMPASPFRFLVIDDPVQAMDPSKVDGLAQVLAGVAAERQVIVFTHDDRLPDAVRRPPSRSRRPYHRRDPPPRIGRRSPPRRRPHRPAPPRRPAAHQGRRRPPPRRTAGHPRLVPDRHRGRLPRHRPSAPTPGRHPPRGRRGPPRRRRQAHQKGCPRHLRRPHPRR